MACLSNIRNELPNRRFQVLQKHSASHSHSMQRWQHAVILPFEDEAGRGSLSRAGAGLRAGSEGLADHAPRRQRAADGVNAFPTSLARMPARAAWRGCSAESRGSGRDGLTYFRASGPGWAKPWPSPPLGPAVSRATPCLLVAPGGLAASPAAWLRYRNANSPPRGREASGTPHRPAPS